MFYDRYCELCKENGLTPSGGAAKIGFNRASVTMWKNTGKAPKQDLLIKIAEFFDVSTDYLLGNVSDPHFHLDNDRILREINSYGDENEKAPTNAGERSISDEELKFALWGDATEIDDDDLEDVRRFAAFVRERKKAQK